MSIRKWCAGLAIAAASLGAGASAAATQAAAATCRLGNRDGRIKHVIYLQFDNTHFNRDRPDVASDLEQMPHLLNVLRGQGTLFTNDHTILISHTAGGILSSLTGLYPDRTGPTVTNSYGFFKPDGTVGFSTAFKYWTDPVDGPDDPLPNMVSDGQKTTPAPWVPYTRAGCDVGGAGAANIELENTTSDITQVFGPGSPEAAEAAANPAKAQADFVGIAVHCAAGGGKCAGDPDAKPDLLPDEPGGYTGFRALYGAKAVDPAITGGQACVTDTSGQPITDPNGNCGFPGFDAMLAKNTLGYVAKMQEAGVPVTYGYLSDAHDNHMPPGAGAFGPGEAGYRAQLKAYDDAFAAFFARLQRDGLNRDNTLLVVTVDEGDHFVGGKGTPQPDGSLAYTHANCSDLTACPANQIGEINVGLNGLLPDAAGTFSVHSDDAPTFYVNGRPDRTNPAVRTLERKVAALVSIDPFAGGAVVPLAERLADPVEEKALHMVNADPARTPTFTMFGNADFFFMTGNPSCGGNPCVSPAFAWNHGDYQHEIANTWVGMVGPGVRPRGIDSSTWTDHTNVRPTMLALLGLRDDYRHDGRVLVEGLRRRATPRALGVHRGTVRRLGAAYEQLNASFGEFALATLQASTAALKSTNDTTYTHIENRIAALTARRDALAGRIKSELEAAAFAARPLSQRRARAQTRRAWRLIDRAAQLGASS
jgi:arylsulfatase A-like enzyme